MFKSYNTVCSRPEHYNTVCPRPESCDAQRALMSVTPNLCCDETEPRVIHSPDTFSRITPLIGAKAPQTGAKASQFGQVQKPLVGPWYQAILGKKFIWTFNLQRRVVSIREAINCSPMSKLSGTIVRETRIGWLTSKGSPGLVHYWSVPLLCKVFLTARLFGSHSEAIAPLNLTYLINTPKSFPLE